MEIVRATREASQCPIGFWPHLVEHAVDVLNRTTGPPRSDGEDNHAERDASPETSSYQHVTGKAPKILTILPLGCRAYAVKPVGSFIKSSFKSRAWSGIEIAIYVIPYLFALSIGTLLMGVLRPTLSSLGNLLRSAYGSWEMTQIRVLLRIATNVVVIATYLSYHLLVNTFVSESSVWPPTVSACLSPSRSRLRDALTTTLATVRALLHGLTALGGGYSARPCLHIVSNAVSHCLSRSTGLTQPA